MDFLLQRCCEWTQVQMVLETYFRLVDKLGPEPFVEHEDFSRVIFEGDFAWKVSVYKDEAHEEALARFLARTLRTKVVISDAAVNPYAWVLVDEQGVAQPVHEEPGHPQGFFVVAQTHRHLLAPCTASISSEASSPI